MEGKPLYFAKTSGTTSGAKYIPLTKESMPYHIEAAHVLLLKRRMKNAQRHWTAFVTV
jgi:acyl-coenzyme A synthetase/AMP-(fatty) acid ligase